ncbi:MAG: dihydrodipicolinate synthase family protein [Terriglobia bacterium]
MKELGGIIPILATPFTERGEVDGESFRRLVEASVWDGIHGLAMFGLGSEYYKLSDAERLSLMELLIGQANGRVPIVLSITHHARDVAVRQAREAVAMGADAVMIMPPFFLGPSVDAIVRHIEAVARAVTVPIIVQYAPLQTGKIISPEAFAELHREHPNVTHVKVDTVPSGTTITALQQASGGSLKTIVGYMGLHLPEDVTRGVAGCAPSASLGRAFVHLWNLLCQGGDEGRIFHQHLLPMLNFMMQSVEMLIACEKLLLVRRGIFPSACSREPAFRLDSFQLAELERHSKALAEWLPKMGAP